MTIGRCLFSLLLLAAVAVGAYLFVVSQHAVGNHVSEAYTSADVLEIITDAARTPGVGPCQPLEVAACPKARVWDKASVNYGGNSPQARVYCGLSADAGLVAVFGLAHPPEVVYITGYPIQRARWTQITYRDKCGAADISYLQRILGINIPPAP